MNESKAVAELLAPTPRGANVIQAAIRAGRRFVLAPFNDVTRALSDAVLEAGGEVCGFSDTAREDSLDASAIRAVGNGVALVFSPSHWQAIAQRLEPLDVFVVVARDGGLEFAPAPEFTGYSERDTRVFNNAAAQRSHWVRHMRRYDWGETDLEHFGFEWGDPSRSDDPLGDYQSIAASLRDLVSADCTVLDLGTLGGKWLPYMLHAKRVICVDINDEFEAFVRQRFPEYGDKLEFYRTSGDELDGVADSSVDFVLSMDSLVRVNRDAIGNYMKAINRVLSPRGQALIHLPCTESEGSQSRGFTDLPAGEIDRMLAELRRPFEVDRVTVRHGVLVRLKRERHQEMTG